MLDADQLQFEVERARRVMTLLNDQRSRLVIDQYVRELESQAALLNSRYAVSDEAVI